MPSTCSSPDTPLLHSLFNEILTATDEKTKSLALGKAKRYILNEMPGEMLKEFFINETMNYESLFSLQIWKEKHQEERVDYMEPYEIIEKILSSFTSLVDFIGDFYGQILFTMKQSEDEKVKHIFVQKMINLTKCLNDSEFEKYPDPCSKLTAVEGILKQMLIIFVHQIPNLSVKYSELLGKLFCHLTSKLNRIEATLIERHHNITSVIFSTSIFDDNPELTNEFERISKISSTMKIRVLEIFVKLATLSKEHLVSISEPNFMNENLKSLLNSNDILTKLNVIELLTDLSMTFYGYEFLLHRGHLKRLFDDLLEFNLLLSKDSSPFGFCEAAAIVKIFANITRTMPDRIKSDFPDYLSIIFDYAMYEDVLKWEFQINLALQTFTYLFESNVVKIFLYENYKEKFEAFLRRLTFIARNVIGAGLKTNSIRCLALVISLDPELLSIDHCDAKWLASPWIQSMEKVCLNFFNICTSDDGEPLFQTLYVLAKEPFPDTRLTAQLFFKALAQSKWGLTFLFSDKKFLKKTEFVNRYLVNRSFEIEKAGLESKLELIKLVCANFKLNNELFPIIGEGDLESLEQYVRLGAYYTPSGQKVAFESA